MSNFKVGDRVYVDGYTIHNDRGEKVHVKGTGVISSTTFAPDVYSVKMDKPYINQHYCTTTFFSALPHELFTIKKEEELRMTKNFKVGDRVCCIEEHDGNTHIIGQVGTVRALVSAFHELAIEFDNDVQGHTLGSAHKCPTGHGWSIPPEKLVPAYLAPRKDTKIIIYTKGNRTFAKVIVGKRTVETECAVCSHDDVFSIFTGAQIALARLAYKNNAKPALSKAALDKALKNFEIIE